MAAKHSMPSVDIRMPSPVDLPQVPEPKPDPRALADFLQVEPTELPPPVPLKAKPTAAPTSRSSGGRARPVRNDDDSAELMVRFKPEPPTKARKSVTVKLLTDHWKLARTLALAQNCTLQDLLEEAAIELLRRHGLASPVHE